MTSEIVTDDEWKEFKKTLGNMTDKEIEKNTKTRAQANFFKELKKEHGKQ